jgi:hypothetical protein
MSATNFTPYTAVTGNEQALTKKPDGRRRMALPMLPPPLVSDYCGRVSSFYSVARSTYSETYEPVRKTELGDVWRIESRLVSGRWVHLPFSLKGQPLIATRGESGTVENSELSLMFDPEAELHFAQTLLERRPKAEFVRIEGEVTVYRSRSDQSIGVVREHVGPI